MFWPRFIFLLITEAAGLALIFWSLHIYNFFGQMQFAEKWLGGTQNFYKFLGIAFMIAGLLAIFGVLDPIINLLFNIK